MVLPDRIELSTSPLPMECSTTELRQHARYPKNRPQRGPCRRAVLATRTPLAQACGGVRKGPKRPKSRIAGGLPVQTGPTRARSGSICFPGPRRAKNHLGASRSRRLRGGSAKPNMGTAAAQPTGPGLQDDQDRRVGKTGDDVKTSREQRLKLALRENLKRRKSQARGRSEEASSETDDVSLDDSSGDRRGQ